MEKKTARSSRGRETMTRLIFVQTHTCVVVTYLLFCTVYARARHDESSVFVIYYHNIHIIITREWEIFRHLNGNGNEKKKKCYCKANTGRFVLYKRPGVFVYARRTDSSKNPRGGREGPRARGTTISCFDSSGASRTPSNPPPPQSDLTSVLTDRIVETHCTV